MSNATNGVANMSYTVCSYTHHTVFSGKVSAEVVEASNRRTDGRVLAGCVNGVWVLVTEDNIDSCAPLPVYVMETSKITW